MAVVSIGHRPELTVDEVRAAFASGFSTRGYEVIKTALRRRDFIVRKDGWSGVGVKLQQRKDDTALVFTAMIPNLWLQFFFGGLFSYLMLRKSWKRLEAEVAEFITNEPAFAKTVDPQEADKAA